VLYVRSCFQCAFTRDGLANSARHCPSPSSLGHDVAGSAAAAVAAGGSPRRAPWCAPVADSGLGLQEPTPSKLTFHGGGGAILSVGLLRAISYASHEACVTGGRWGGKVGARLATPGAKCHLVLGLWGAGRTWMFYA
jgi:hypothetical protein